MFEGFFPFRSGATANRGSAAQPVIGDEAQQLHDLVHGKHYNDVLAGRVFSQSCTPLGLAIPIYTGTALAGGMPVWNPTGSGVNLELISVSTGRASGTSDFGAIGLMALDWSGVSVATGSIVTAFAATQPKNAKLFGGLASKARSSNAGTVTITAGAAGDWIRTLFSHSAEADATTTGVHPATHDFDGSIIVPPGAVVWIADTKATTALYATTIVWKEIPTS